MYFGKSRFERDSAKSLRFVELKRFGQAEVRKVTVSRKRKFVESDFFCDNEQRSERSKPTPSLCIEVTHSQTCSSPPLKRAKLVNDCSDLVSKQSVDSATDLRTVQTNDSSEAAAKKAAVSSLASVKPKDGILQLAETMQSVRSKEKASLRALRSAKRGTLQRPFWMLKGLIADTYALGADSGRQLGDCPISALKLQPLLAAALRSLDFSGLMAVQRAAIPSVLRALVTDRDVVICTETGSGKTLAYALPIAHILLTALKGSGSVLRVLVVVPSKDLAIQTENVFGQLRCGHLLENGSVVVCSAQRLLASFHSGAIDLSNLLFLVLDECDKLLRAADFRHWFQCSSLQLAASGCKTRKVVLSATLSENPKVLASLGLSKPLFVGTQSAVTVSAEHLEKQFEVPKSISQLRCVLNLDLMQRCHLLSQPMADAMSADAVSADAIVGKLRKSKRALALKRRADARQLARLRSAVGAADVLAMKCAMLCALIFEEMSHVSTFLVFADSQRSVSLLKRFVKSEAKRRRKQQTAATVVDELGAGKSAKERVEALQKLRHGAVFGSVAAIGRVVLFCTHSMARGIDVGNLECVVNVNCPLSAEAYVHRCGRTSRGAHAHSQMCAAVTLLCQFDEELRLFDSEILPFLTEASRKRVQAFEFGFIAEKAIATCYQRAKNFVNRFVSLH